MKQSIIFFFIVILFFGCSKEPKIVFNELPKTYLLQSEFSKLPNFNDENYDEVLEQFKNNCKTKKSKNLYGDLCIQAKSTQKAKEFLLDSFKPYLIVENNSKEEGLLTGYYEPRLYASLDKNDRYKYPIYQTPSDLITVDLSSIYPDLKNYRLRGKIEGNRLVPYDTRDESKEKSLNADVLCYCDSQIDRFFLEIQGSGRVLLDNNETIFIGYDNQNGHQYRAIGRYLVKINELSLEEVSLQSIKAWLENNPTRIDEVLNYNKSMVFFKQKSQAATGALGLELTPTRSIAVDQKYIPLGSMLYMDAEVNKNKFNKVVFAQDTGGAIKGSIRADLFLGSGDEALAIAGRLKSPLKLWILMPKSSESRVYE